MFGISISKNRSVNCRIGSLEKNVTKRLEKNHVNCRIGSLEKNVTKRLEKNHVNCRIGSLEKYGK